MLLLFIIIVDFVLALLQVTESPFINAIFDGEPLDQFVWGRVALLGEAAHPTTPHGLRRSVLASRYSHGHALESQL